MYLRFTWNNSFHAVFHISVLYTLSCYHTCWDWLHVHHPVKHYLIWSFTKQNGEISGIHGPPFCTLSASDNLNLLPFFSYATWSAWQIIFSAFLSLCFSIESLTIVRIFYFCFLVLRLRVLTVPFLQLNKAIRKGQSELFVVVDLKCLWELFPLTYSLCCSRHMFFPHVIIISRLRKKVFKMLAE